VAHQLDRAVEQDPPGLRRPPGAEELLTRLDEELLTAVDEVVQLVVADAGEELHPPQIVEGHQIVARYRWVR
jgi:hypothetical protein